MCGQYFNRHYTFGNWTRANKALEIPGQGYYLISVNITLSFDSFGATTNTFAEGMVVKLDYNGDTLVTTRIGNEDTLYQHLFGSNSDDFFRGGVVTDDGNILVTGETQSYNAENYYDYDLWLLKYNTNLDTLWTKLISIPDTQIAVVNSIASKTTEGGFSIVGIQGAFNGSGKYGYLAVFDSSGTLKFRTTPYKQYNGYFMGSVQTPDKGFIITGARFAPSVNNQAPLILKTDSLGALQWQYSLPYSLNYNLAINVIRTQDGNYVYTWIRVVQNPGATYKVWRYHFTKIDVNGTELWSKSHIYSFNGHQRLYEMPNGKLMFAGDYTDTLGTGRAGFIMVCDANGDSLWVRQYRSLPGSAPGNLVTCMDGIPTSDGGYLLTGETSCCNFTPNVGWTTSLWALKTDSLGLITSAYNMPQPLQSKSALHLPFPNPASGFCTITSLVPPNSHAGFGEAGAYLLLFDMQGRQLQKLAVSPGLNHTTIDISKYASGTYLIVLAINGHRAGSQKLVVQH